ncbi:hypothetical protein NC653_027940 [Populus alba x Populus x berolinensis]|uniref:Uncharacterized protein n=1 Tax=Populus alba x Populus x berolinensis TaxID=444605 RepID=A0AAD6M6M9_9ROSI|nr:hypothetical protein NC653_027937 [Populus alba x Populus x berolinensis]KAJ6979961.1 hypothetical protein NC653_027940 [Populus alba x Populus x berolinensis]
MIYLLIYLLLPFKSQILPYVEFHCLYYILDIDYNLQEHFIILIRRGRVMNLPAVKDYIARQTLNHVRDKNVLVHCVVGCCWLSISHG